MSILNMVWWWKKWGNIWEPLNLAVTSLWLDATITWEDNEIWTIPPTTFQKSELVRKIGSAPTSPSDWDLVVTETVKDTYKVSGYVDQWLTDWETYYYRVFSYSDLGGISYCDAVNVTVSTHWIPTSNTIVYFPLTDDLDDYYGNYTLTANNWAVIWTVDWVKCLDFSASNSYADCSISTLPQWWQVRTNMCWVRYNSIGWYPAYQYGQWSFNQWDVIYQNGPITWSNYWKTIASNTTPNIWDWVHIAVTINWSSEQKIYINWVLESSGSWTVQTNWTTLYLWYCVWDSTYIDWYIGSFIIEDKVRTAQEISDYYDFTKWDYWIS